MLVLIMFYILTSNFKKYSCNYILKLRNYNIKQKLSYVDLSNKSKVTCFALHFLNYTIIISFLGCKKY